MKRYLNVFIVMMMMLSFSSLMADTWTEDFDTDGNWSGGSSSGYNAKEYTNSSAPGSLSFSTSAAVRETSTTNSSGYAWRTDDLSGADLTADMDLTVNGFSVYIARWDNSPKPNVDIEYSTDGGSNYTLIEAIDGDIFSEDKTYQLYSHTFVIPISPDAGSTVVIRFNTTSGERMLYDDFTVDYGTGGTTPTALTADFSADVTSGTVPLTVNFTPAVTGGTSPYGYAWDFDNDGTVDSTDENPNHTYSTVGTFSVKLTVTDGVLASDAEEKIDYITVNAEPVVGDGVATDLFFSEYIEGSSNNKAIEIFNGTGASVDLSIYTLKKGTNGADFSQEYSLSDAVATLANNDVVVITNSSANAEIEAAEDATAGIVSFNGDDAMGLFKNGNLIDVIGLTTGTDPGTGWEVAGVNNGTADHTLVRKSTVSAPTTDWATSAGTNETDSQWIVNSQDDASNLGSHTFDGVAVEPGALSVDFSADVTSGNPSQTVNFTNLVTGGTAPYIYSWDFDDDGIDDSSAANPSFTYTSVGTYTVSLYVIDTDANDATETKTAYITITEAGSYDGYYSDITATGGETLKTQLANLISTNTSSSYDGARHQMYGYIDNINGIVSCIYTGEEFPHTYGTTSAPSGINCEHTYAQSWITDYDNQGEEGIAKADVHHLFPTESGVNSSRSSYSFDNVSGTPTYSYPDPPVGYTSYGGNNADGTRIFEVADQHKGNTARAMLYMNVRYNLPLEPQSSDPGSSTDGIDVDMLTTLLQWHNADPVDAAEITRNDGIESYQSNRNPFVDHPEWVSAVYGGVSVDTCIKPVMNPAGATFDAVQNVAITTTTAGASIYYTTNGDTPTSGSTFYNGTIEVAADMTIKAIAVKADYNDSQVATEEYIIDIIPTVSIYDIQYVADPTTSDASAYEGQTVNVTGIITAVNGNSFYLSAPAGGAWNAVYVYNSGQSPAMGDEVTFNAEVAEFSGLTELVNVTNFSTISSNNSVTPLVITTLQTNDEAYEGVLVTIENVTVTEVPDYYNVWKVSDGSGDANIDDNVSELTTTPLLNSIYSSITGPVSYGYGAFAVNPRSDADVVLDTQANQVPIISNVAYSPALIFAEDIVTITADVIDNDGTLATVNLKWGTATASYTTTTPMSLARAGYNANIPAQAEGTVVYYVVEATDDDSDTTTSEESSYTVLAEPGEGVATDLFISEYVEKGNDKAIEIFNGTGLPVDLSIYTIIKYTNGASTGTPVTLTGSLATNDVYVIAYNQASQTIRDLADLESTSIGFNGDDAVALLKNDVVIDVIGEIGDDPGSYWTVGATGSTADQTLVRKSSISSPNAINLASFGSTDEDSEWDLYPEGTITYLGSHTFDGAGSTPTVVATPAITPEAGEYNNEVEVTITCATADATIYYSLDGSAPTLAYSAPFTLTADATVKAYATKAELDDSAIAEAVYTIVTVIETVETPVITPATGTYYAEQSVTIETATADATIYYTLDGTDPTTASSVYTDAIAVTATTTVKAYAAKAGWTDSAIAESIITIEELNYTPGMFISEYGEAGSGNSKYVEIYNGTGAEVDLTPYVVRVANNGGDWGNSYDMTGTLAAGEVFVIANSSSVATILASADATSNIAYFNGNDAVGLLYNDIPIDVIGVQGVDPGDDSAWDVAGQTEATMNHVLVRKNTVTDGTTDWALSAGTTPEDSQWIVYPDATYDYLGYHGIDVVAVPSISPEASSYTDEVEITITCPTDGATIYYTLDGNDPTASSTEYTAPFTITADATLKAIAMKADYENSAIVSAEYTIIDSGDVPTGMIISEYIEGSSNNKAIEIYNGTGADVDLTPYIVKLAANGGDWNNTADLEGTLGAGDVFVLANSGSNEAILALADSLSTVTYFNGDDVVGLFYNEVLIDVFGTYQTDPGASWDVAGVTGATVNYTLVRKLTVTQGTTDWALSAGTDATDSQWVVYPMDTIDMLGSHTTPLDIVSAPVITPDGGDYQDDVVVSLTTTTADAAIYYTLDGSTPTDASALYSAPFTLTEDATVKAIAMKAGFFSSTMTSADFTVTQVTFEDGFTISETELTFTSEVGVESEIQSYTFYMQGSELAMVEVTGDFQIQDTEGAWGTDFFIELDEEEVTINVKFNATAAGTVYGEIIHESDEFDDDFVISLTGTANEVLPTSIYDIQFPTDLATSDASPYDGQEVIVEGIVTANNYGGKYFISSPAGGAWNGIYVFDTNNEPELGDLVTFTATVDEYYEWTELTNVTDYSVISTGNAIPAPVVLTTAELASMEAYESVLVTIEDVTVTSALNSYGEWYVTDGSGDAQIDGNCFVLDPEAIVGDAFASITGVVDYSFDEYGLNPRDANDIVTTPLVTELDTPVITSITKVAGGIQITWDAVDNANSYNVYVSDTPDGDYGTEPYTTVDGTEYIYTTDDAMKFFYIEASTDSMPVAKK